MKFQPLYLAAYDSTTTWANAENSGVGEIDRPGNYELTARTSDVTDAYSLSRRSSFFWPWLHLRGFFGSYRLRRFDSSRNLFSH